MGRDGIQHLARGRAGGQGFLSGEVGQMGFPVLGQLALNKQVPGPGQFGIHLAIGAHHGFPLTICLFPGLLHGLHPLPGLFRDIKRFVLGKAEKALGLSHALRPQGFTMDLGRVLTGAAIADVGAAGNDGRPIRLRLGRAQGSIHRLHVVAIHPLYMPAIGLKPLQHLLGEGDLGGPIDGDVIVIVQHDEFAQAPMAGQRSSLMRDPFHQIPVASQDIGVVVHHREAGPIEAGREPALRQGHPHCVADPLPQRACGHLDPPFGVIFRMARGHIPPLTEMLQLIQGDGITEQVEQ